MKSSCDSDDPSADLRVCPNPARPDAIVPLYQICQQCSPTDMNISVDLTKKVSAKKKVIFLSKKHLSKGSDDYLCIIAFQVSNTWYRVDIWHAATDGCAKFLLRA